MAETKYRFNIGDRVVATENMVACDGVIKGKAGRIISFDFNDTVSVEFDDPVRDVAGRIVGHKGATGVGRRGHCYNVLKRRLEPEYSLPDVDSDASLLASCFGI